MARQSCLTELLPPGESTYPRAPCRVRPRSLDPPTPIITLRSVAGHTYSNVPSPPTRKRSRQASTSRSEIIPPELVGERGRLASRAILRRQRRSRPRSWNQLDPWLEFRGQLPIGALLCVIHGPIAGRRGEI